MELTTLKEMGIEKFDEITHYTWRQKSSKMDELVVYYKRKKGSFRPVYRAYEFGRSIKTIVEDSGQPRFEDTYEVSPTLLSAVSELNHLLKLKDPDVDLKKILLKEIDELKELASSDANTALQEKIESLKTSIGRM